MSSVEREARLRTAFRREVRQLYDTACTSDGSAIPTLSQLAAWISAHGDEATALDVVEWATGRRLNAEASAAAPLLLGLNETRGLHRKARLAKAAGPLGYKSGEALRNSKRQRRNHIELILDQIADGLVAIALEHGFTPNARVVTDQDADAVYPLLSTRLMGLRADRSQARIGDTLWLEYIINSQAKRPGKIWLSASLLDSSNNEFSDMHNDRLITVKHGMHRYRRRFTIGTQFQPGRYRLVGGLWHGSSILSADAVRFQATDQAGTVLVSAA